MDDPLEDTTAPDLAMKPSERRKPSEPQMDRQAAVKELVKHAKMYIAEAVKKGRRVDTESPGFWREVLDHMENRDPGSTEPLLRAVRGEE